jgi:hypothetical protein
MNRACMMFLALVLVCANPVDAGSKKKEARKAKAEVTHETRAPHAALGSPVAREAHGHGASHGGEHHASPQWPNPHEGPTTAHPLEQRPIMFHEHGHHVGSYDVMGHWITHY